MIKTMSVFIYLYNFNARIIRQKEGTEMFCFSSNTYVMMHMHKWLLKFSQTKHDDLTIFFPITIMVRNQ